MATPKPSMREIAAQAGVSVVAVSCALRGSPGVSEATRAKIRAIADSLGYRPDPLLSHLMYHLRSKRTPKGRHNIAFLHWPKDRYRELVLEGARARAEQHGYHIDVIKLTDNQPGPRALQRMLLARGVSGLLLGPSPVKDYSDLLDWQNFAVILTSYSVISPRFHRVVPNQYTATQLALHELGRRGYSRIGLIVPPWVEERVNHFHSVAFTWAAAQNKAKPLLCYHDPYTSSLADLRKWCHTHRPDALVLCFPLDYEEVLCKALGRAAVSRLGIVSLGYDTQCANTMTVDYRPSMLGAVAVDQLITQLHRGERGIPQVQQTLSLEGHLLDASSP
ncbi:MAG: LacI family DNA-binding transcriptional regulator [Opitutaceae bacterium]|nr:LacI family DNA-binding transcriptional regulator [Opitutaceae bacterium]